MNKSVSKVIIILILIAIGFFSAKSLAQAQDEPKAVALASFKVVPLNNAVRIDWETGTELGTAGFFIKRGAPGGPYETLSYLGENGIIYATGQGTVGSIYSVTDNQVQNGSRYTYILYELESNSAETELARETVTVGIPPTNTPVIASGNPSGSTATATPRAATPATPTVSAENNTGSATITPASAATAPAFVTITPQTNQPDATAVPSTSDTTNQSRPANNSAANQSPETNSANTTGSVNVASALEEEPESIALSPAQAAPPAQEGYPEAPTAVSDAPTAYPQETNSLSAAPEMTATTVPVIGGQGYTGAQNQNPGSAAANNRGTIFLWLGFIIALLIFVTGIIGSILLFVRKS